MLGDGVGIGVRRIGLRVSFVLLFLFWSGLRR